MTTHDAGLRAVARVREVRERDSRHGLSTAVAEHASVETGVRALEERLAAEPTFVAGSSSTFLADRTHTVALGLALRDRREDLQVSSSVVASANAHWLSDRARLDAVRLLLDRRAEARRTERARAEAASLDDAATQGWLRRHREQEVDA